MCRVVVAPRNSSWRDAPNRKGKGQSSRDDVRGADDGGERVKEADGDIDRENTLFRKTGSGMRGCKRRGSDRDQDRNRNKGDVDEDMDSERDVGERMMSPAAGFNLRRTRDADEAEAVLRTSISLGNRDPEVVKCLAQVCH
jgi:hypothetical protein